MSFNDGFSSRGVDYISGSDGEVLTRVAGQWVSAPNMGSGGSFTGVTLDPTNPNLEGHGTALEPLKVKSNLNVTSVTASFSGDGFNLTNLSTSVDHVLFVAHDGDDNHVGSLTDPFRTISGAIAYANIKYPDTNDSVLIEVRPGSYSEDLLITRPNLYIRGVAVRPEQRSVEINGKTKVSVNANDKYDSTVAFQGVFFNYSNPANPAVNLSSSTNLVYFKDCYFAANGSNCLKVENVTTASAKIVVSECIFWGGQGNTDIINISGGDVKIDTAEIYFTAGATGTGNGVYQNGNSLVMADRVLVDLNTKITGSAFFNASSNFNALNPTPTLYVSNASISTSNASANGTLYSSNITYLWNVLFTNSSKIKGVGPIATVVYSDLTTTNGLTFETINKSLLNDYMGNVSGSTFTGSFSGSYRGDGSLLINLPLSSYATLAGVSASFARLDIPNTYSANQTINASISSSVLTSSGAHFVYVDFDSVVTPPAGHVLGRVHYDSVSGDLKYHTDISPNTVNLGQQLVQRVQYNDGGTLLKGTVVHISGLGNGDIPKISKASVTQDSLSANTLGIVLEDISNGSSGYVILQGILTGLNINNSYNAGDILYLSGSVGLFSTEKTIAPNHLVSVGQVLKTGGNGSIYVKIQNGYEIEELHDVLITNKLNNDLLVWNNSAGVWKNTSSLGSYTFNGNQQVTGSVFVNTAISASQFTGSFSGSGAGLYNIPASSVSLTGYAKLDTANIFTANQTVSGSLFVSSSLSTLDGLTGSAITSSNTLQVGGQSTFGGGVKLPIKTVTNNYTLTASTDYIVAFNGSNLTGTLPSAAAIGGSTFIIKNLSTSSVLITDGISTIDGQVSVIIYNQYSSYTFVSDNTNWLIV